MSPTQRKIFLISLVLSGLLMISLIYGGIAFVDYLLHNYG